jgi:hypothetical protein
MNSIIEKDDAEDAARMGFWRSTGGMKQIVAPLTARVKHVTLDP